MSNTKFGSLCYSLKWVSFNFFICNVFGTFCPPLIFCEMLGFLDGIELCSWLIDWLIDEWVIESLVLHVIVWNGFPLIFSFVMFLVLFTHLFFYPLGYSRSVWYSLIFCDWIVKEILLFVKCYVSWMELNYIVDWLIDEWLIESLVLYVMV